MYVVKAQYKNELPYYAKGSFKKTVEELKDPTSIWNFEDFILDIDMAEETFRTLINKSTDEYFGIFNYGDKEKELVNLSIIQVTYPYKPHTEYKVVKYKEF